MSGIQLLTVQFSFSGEHLKRHGCVRPPVPDPGDETVPGQDCRLQHRDPNHQGHDLCPALRISSNAGKLDRITS